MSKEPLSQREAASRALALLTMMYGAISGENSLDEELLVDVVGHSADEVYDVLMSLGGITLGIMDLVSGDDPMAIVTSMGASLGELDA